MLAALSLQIEAPMRSDSITDEDSAWVAKAARGDRRAFEWLYRKHARRVFGVIWRLVGGVEARAEELTQDAFIRAWQKLSAFRGDSTFSTWLHRLAVNTALMDLRGRSGAEDREVDESALESHAATAATPALRIDLERAVSSLPERARAVLILFDIEGWNHEEISVELGMAVGSSKAQLHRARQLLRDRLGGESHE